MNQRQPSRGWLGRSNSPIHPRPRARHLQRAAARCFVPDRTRLLDMTATIYPRINPTVAADIRTGAALAPLRIQQSASNPGTANTVISAGDKDTAALAAVAVVPGVSPPDAPGQVLPFRVQYGDQPVHIKVSFFGDPAAATPFSLPADLRVAVIPNQAFS